MKSFLMFYVLSNPYLVFYILSGSGTYVRGRISRLSIAHSLMALFYFYGYSITVIVIVLMYKYCSYVRIKYWTFL